MRFKRTNNKAILGFLMPFINMGLVSGVVLWGRAHDVPFPLWLPLLTVVPLIMIAGLYYSIKSIPLIDELGDKDYAYSGLVLNVFIIGLYIFSFFYYINMPAGHTPFGLQ